MKSIKVCAIALAMTLIGCGKEHSTNSSTVHFMAIDRASNAASIEFRAYSAADPTRIVGSQKLGSFSPGASGREFTGELVVEPGAYVFRAVSFDPNGTPLGEGAAEDARPITTTKGAKTSVSITIMSYEQQVVGPVISSFVVTPTGSTVVVNTPVTLAATVAYQGTSTLQYRWTQDCTHGLFSTPTDGLTATWSNPAEESCTLHFTVTDPANGRTDSRSVSLTCSCLGTSALRQALIMCE